MELERGFIVHLDDSQGPKRRGILVLMSILIIIMLVILIGILRDSSQFDNEKLEGTYVGNLTFSEIPIIPINITFSGGLDFNGTMDDNGTIKTFTGEYQLIGLDLQFSFDLENYTYVIFLGNLEGDGTIVRGDIRYYYNAADYYEGSAFLSLLEN